MNTVVCCKCNHIFDAEKDIKTKVNNHYIGFKRIMEKTYHCPYCGSQDWGSIILDRKDKN